MVDKIKKTEVAIHKVGIIVDQPTNSCCIMLQCNKDIHQDWSGISHVGHWLRVQATEGLSSQANLNTQYWGQYLIHNQGKVL